MINIIFYQEIIRIKFTMCRWLFNTNNICVRGSIIINIDIGVQAQLSSVRPIIVMLHLQQISMLHLELLLNRGVLPPWKAAKTGTISFKIRTNEPNGLIMYSRSGAQTRVFDKSFSMVSKFKPIHLHLLVIPLTPTIRRQNLCAHENGLLYVEVAKS
ncbi:hypothetical protein ALC60_14363 [Trachymyrmex zeteki]|uniref:Uncharacterized protein n=1 Tax=Mycetomoellerius zeteki TaxID=64791 RepID=A0A151WFJ7_9HYME|nr:hypothetical protein ALC60_14363 [Trachymyrmex zeteki]